MEDRIRTCHALHTLHYHTNAAAAFGGLGGGWVGQSSVQCLDGVIGDDDLKSGWGIWLKGLNMVVASAIIISVWCSV